MSEWLPRELVSGYFRKSRDYFRVYKDGVTGPEADRAAKIYKSHRRPPPSEDNVRSQKLRPWDVKKALLALSEISTGEPVTIRQPTGITG